LSSASVATTGIWAPGYGIIGYGLSLGLPTGDGGRGLRNLLKSNSACSAVLGGTDRGLAILSAANRVKTYAPGFTPPTSFLSPEGNTSKSKRKATQAVQIKSH